ncbi:unnamed protein product [Rhizophagus irregularis]|nr:unnamed protein product [Rhizophagus irregularis]
MQQKHFIVINMTSIFQIILMILINQAIRMILQINDEIMQQTKGRPNIGDFNDEDETYNNPNFHSEEQNELEIPDDV